MSIQINGADLHARLTAVELRLKLAEQRLAASEAQIEQTASLWRACHRWQMRSFWHRVRRLVTGT